mmetsp:Transcript_92913/g.300471  ORF Transcript_92913/g.300471 Transcript_92913/m.300471 type:complete len:226 (-) Transcript_92913:7-684(-)
MAVLLGAADLTDGCLCIAVTVGHVVPDQSDQRHRVLLLCVLQDALDALRGVAVDLVLFVDPIRGAHLAHRLQVLADFLGLHGLHGVLIPLLIQGVNIVRHVLEGVLARGLQEHKLQILPQVGRGRRRRQLGSQAPGRHGREGGRQEPRCGEAGPARLPRAPAFRADAGLAGQELHAGGGLRVLRSQALALRGIPGRRHGSCGRSEGGSFQWWRRTCAPALLAKTA